jgi:hypothetical protein
MPLSAFLGVQIGARTAEAHALVAEMDAASISIGQSNAHPNQQGFRCCTLPPGFALCRV